MKQLAVLPMLVRQHAEDAAFLFAQRGQAVHEQSWDDVQLGRCDQRIAANIAGLLAAGTTGLEIAAEYMKTVGGAGEVFALAMTALAQGEALEPVIACVDTAQGRRGLSGALARTDALIVGPHVRPWLQSEEPGLRLLALMALSHHRRDPGQSLAGFLGDPATEVRSRASRLAFELGRADLAGPLSELATVEAEELWPALALARFGKGAARLYDLAARPGQARAGLALDAAIIAAPDLARDRLGEMMRRPETRPLALSRAGVMGDQSLAGWLWQHLNEAQEAESVLFALFDLYPIDPDLCSELGIDPERPGAGAERPATVEAWLNAHSADTPHLSLRRQMLGAMRAGFKDKKTPISDWRKTRTFPAWS